MLWIILVILIFLLGGGLVGYLMYSKVAAVRKTFERNMQVLQEEKEKKESILRNLSEVNLALASLDDLEKKKDELTSGEEGLRAERGRLTITQAELEAVETRLRELEEIERELESSALETSQELEMLRSQERDIEARSDRLKAELENSLFQIDILIDQLSSNSEAVEKITRSKTQLLEAQEKIEIIENSLGEINARYLDLKKAYDALDIEYAQLYEKQNSLGN